MFMKTRRLIVDIQLKRKAAANKQLMIKLKKQKTEHSSGLGNPVGDSSKPFIQNGDGVVEDSQILTSGSCKKGTMRYRKLKRKLSSILRKSVKCRKKRKIEQIGKVDETVEPVDRISELPEPIIHHILSYLRCPKDVTRTTVWSKKWRLIWASFFTFDFDQRKFNTSGRNHPEKFITFVDNSLATKVESMHYIQKFKISLSKPSIKLILSMNNWINAAINKDVRELEVHVERDMFTECYLLPNTVSTSKNLTSLKLYGCKINTHITINLCNLKELSIKNAHANADLINNFVQGCPLVEDLRLIHCEGVGHLHISSLHKLQMLQLHECHGLVSVNIKSTTLRYFLYWAKDHWDCILNLMGCENLKSLSIKHSNMKDVVFQDLIMKFPHLEKVVLRECNKIKRVTILSKTLKELYVIKCKKLTDSLIDAPNLSAFEYSGERMPFDLMHISGLLEAKLHLQIGKDGFAHVRELLQKFEKNGGWKLVVNSSKLKSITIHEEIPKSQKNLTIDEELPKNKNPSSKEIKLELVKSPMKLNAYVDNLLRMSRPKTLSLVSSSSSELLNFLKEKIMSRDQNPKCCTYYSKKCWLHHIKDVSLVVRSNGAEIGGVTRKLQQTTFKFNWKSSKNGSNGS